MKPASLFEKTENWRKFVASIEATDKKRAEVIRLQLDLEDNPTDTVLRQKCLASLEGYFIAQRDHVGDLFADFGPKVLRKSHEIMTIEWRRGYVKNLVLCLNGDGGLKPKGALQNINYAFKGVDKDVFQFMQNLRVLVNQPVSGPDFEELIESVSQHASHLRTLEFGPGPVPIQSALLNQLQQMLPSLIELSIFLKAGKSKNASALKKLKHSNLERLCIDYDGEVDIELITALMEIDVPNLRFLEFGPVLSQAIVGFRAELEDMLSPKYEVWAKGSHDMPTVLKAAFEKHKLVLMTLQLSGEIGKNEALCF